MSTLLTAKHCEFPYGEHTITIETGRFARQATGAVLLTIGDTQMLATVVGRQDRIAKGDFLPLTVNYQEKFYAAGQIPGGYFKREGRPTEKETLTSRLIDRPIRPLFPKGFRHDLQVMVTVMSADPNIPTEAPAIIAASAALAVSGIPFQGPLAGAHVGYHDGQYTLNPSQEQLETSELDLMVAGTREAVLMVESSAKELSEKVMLGAVMYGHQQMQAAIDAIESLAKDVAKTPWSWQPKESNTILQDAIKTMAAENIESAYKVTDKVQRYEQLEALQQQAIATFCVESTDESSPTGTEMEVIGMLGALKKDHVRGLVLADQPRIDGRDLTTVRPIEVISPLLKRTHGSAAFTRGETQVFATITLGNARDAQMIEGLGGTNKRRFMLHYNFPPFCVGEVSFMLGPKRREIGHGKLAWRALEAVLPTAEQFPYVMRAVAETTESNGSSSMATICASSMAMMDAGVPIKSAVAGIAMGLIKEGEQFAVLTDILGDEDHLGDMDFKVAGTSDGITALQMDIKITGINEAIMDKALSQAKDARMHILSIMQDALEAPRTELSAHAPRIISFSINPDKIRDVIGKGGATIRSLTEETGASIDITDDGTITVCAQDLSASENAKEKIELLVADVEVGKIYEGKVMKIVEFGAFVNILPGKDGLVHVSQIAEERVNDVHDWLTEGQTIKVKVLEVDRMGKVRLSMKGLNEKTSS